MTPEQAIKILEAEASSYECVSENPRHFPDDRSWTARDAQEQRDIAQVIRDLIADACPEMYERGAK